MSVSRLLNPRGPATAGIRAAAGRGYVYDADAEAYIAAVEQADGQRLEWGVRQAISQFVAGCKTDGVWTPIKASCILMGARTLTGALTPLVGSAPTSYNFVSGDYSRTAGLVGNGGSFNTKYLDTGRNNNASGQNNFHLALFGEDPNTLNTSYAGTGSGTTAGSSFLFTAAAFLYGQNRSASNNTNDVPRRALSKAFFGMSRSASGTFGYQFMGLATTATRTSDTPADGNLFVFARNDGGTATGYTNARFAFYSTGDAVTLSSLANRVSALYWAINAALT